MNSNVASQYEMTLRPRMFQLLSAYGY